MIRTLFEIWVRPFSLAALSWLLVVALGYLLDIALISTGHLNNPIFAFVLPSKAQYQNLIGNTVEFLASIVGIAITVASILVQLSANRYSSRVIDLFIEDRVVQLVFTFYIVTPLQGLWLAYAVEQLPYPSSQVVLFLLMAVLNMLLLLPVFNYIFHFLRPENIVRRIQDSVSLQHLSSQNAAARDTLRSNMISSMTQLSDVVMNSISSSDMHLAQLSIESLKELASDYLDSKSEAPDDWFIVPRRIFLGLEEVKLTEIAREGIWVEMHCLKQYELIFVMSLNRVREVAAAIANRTQDLGRLALKRKDKAVFQLCILFFNTYLRHALNSHDVRTMFHVFYQYRRMAEACLNEEWGHHLRNIAEYFKYYGHECERRGITFVMEIAAYDVRILVEQADNCYPPVVDELLGVFLEVDHVPDAESERSQRGVRKNQAILAAFFLARGKRELARRIFADMLDEDRERMASIGRELQVMTTETFWEIQDRDSNFYYVSPDHLGYLREFFSWFLEVEEE